MHSPALARPQISTTLVVLICCAHLGCDQALSRKKQASESDAGPRQVYALGRLQPAGGVISISAIPGERLKQIDPDVEENQLVPANGILGVLASFDIGKTQLQALEKKAQLSDLKRNHEVQIAMAQQAQAEAALAQAEAKQRELELQSGKLGTYEVACELAEQQYDRLLQLSQADPELVTPHQLAKQANEMEMARQDSMIASQSYASTKDAADKAVAAAQANIRVAAMTLEQLAQGYDKQAIEQEIMVAQETLKRSVLLAPNVSVASIDVDAVECVKDCEADNPETFGPFTVLKIFVRPGEFVTQMPIMQLGDLSKMVCIAEVYEADVKEIEAGQEVVLRSPAFSSDYANGEADPKTGLRSGGIKGRVQRIGNLIASPGLANRNPLAPADRSVIEVRIEILDQEAIKHAAKRVGLQVTVEFGDKPADEVAP